MSHAFPVRQTTSAVRGLALLAACFLAWSLLLPDGARAATTDVTSGVFTNFYGNTGDATPPTDTNSSNRDYTLGNGSSGPTISGNEVAGGQTVSDTTSGTASNNALTINGGTSFTNTGYISIYGGRVPGASSTGNANSNSVTFGGTNFTTSGNIIVYGGRAHGSGNAVSNIVTISSGNTNDFSRIYGGYANNGNVTGNTVNIAGGGQIGAITGGVANSSGDAGANGAANVVNVTGGSANILNGIMGGTTGGPNPTGSASYNEVHIGSGYSGTIGGDVVGGWVTSAGRTHLFNIFVRYRLPAYAHCRPILPFFAAVGCWPWAISYPA
jgi:hypothetical protein